MMRKLFEVCLHHLLSRVSLENPLNHSLFGTKLPSQVLG